MSETQQAEAQFLLKLKSELNLSEKAIDDIMETTKQMIQNQSSKIKERQSTEIPECILHDPMHVLFGGIVKVQLQLT